MSIVIALTVLVSSWALARTEEGAFGDYCLFQLMDDAEGFDRRVDCQYVTDSAYYAEIKKMTTSYAAYVESGDRGAFQQLLSGIYGNIRSQHHLPGCIREENVTSQDALYQALIRRCADDRLITLDVSAVQMPAIAEQAGLEKRFCTQDNFQSCVIIMNLLRYDSVTLIEQLFKNDGVGDYVSAHPPSATLLFLIVQHSPNSEFQEMGLEHLTPLAEQGLLDGRMLAMLLDRVTGKKSGKQVYGTQFKCENCSCSRAYPINDEDAVDERRKAMGMAPLAEAEATQAASCGKSAAQ